MIKPLSLIFCACLCALSLHSCSQEKADPTDTTPLTAAECVQLEAKTVELMKAQLEKEYPGGSKGLTMKMDPACNTLKEKGRMQFNCTMSATTVDEMHACMYPDR